MTNSSYYSGRNSFMSADLKRTAHAVRQKIDSMPVTTDPVTGREVNPRKRRLVSIQRDNGIEIVQPHLSPAVRHAMSWGRR